MIESSHLMGRDDQAWKKHVKSWAGQFLFGSGLYRPFLRNKVLIVAFHRVNAGAAGDDLSCPIPQFELFCKFFRDHFRVMALPQLVERMQRGQSCAGELAITFDDGYRDNYEYAAPILEKHQLPATFFVTSGFIDTDLVPWWDQRLTVRHRWMTWKQVQELAERGFDIGAHTRTHVDLGKVVGAEAWDEIRGAREDLQTRIGKAVTMFAYPYGRANQITEETLGFVKQAGFTCCCSCFGGINLSMTDPFDLRRLPISLWYDTAAQWGFESIREQR